VERTSKGKEGYWKVLKGLKEKRIKEAERTYKRNRESELGG